MIVVVDSGSGNLQSVVRSFERVGARAAVSVSPADLEAADRIVLPGVGSAAAAMATLAEHRLIEPMTRRVLQDGVPFLGICLGLQLLTHASEEGGGNALGWIGGRAVRLCPNDPQLKVPHLGWNTLAVHRREPLFHNIPEDACFYFAHSYCVQCDQPGQVAAEASYGGSFAAAVQRDNIFGVQFHPEKSHANGLQVLRNFVEYA